MADPILGIDVIIQFYKGGNFFNYGCAENVEIQFSMETKSVKTIGDGVNKRQKGQSLGYQIELSGLLLDDSTLPVAFDLLDYHRSMADINFRLLFYDNAGLKKTITGYALPINVNLAGGSEGFGSGNITLAGNGDLNQLVTPPNPNPVPNPPTQPLPNCDAVIGTAHIGTAFPATGLWLYIDTMTSGSVTRYDYTIDGGGVQTAFTGSTLPVRWKLPNSFAIGSHTVIVTPICDNGYSGTTYTIHYP
jgi:hypothetical protein